MLDTDNINIQRLISLIRIQRVHLNINVMYNKIFLIIIFVIYCHFQIYKPYQSKVWTHNL